MTVQQHRPPLSHYETLFPALCCCFPAYEAGQWGNSVFRTRLNAASDCSGIVTCKTVTFGDPKHSRRVHIEHSELWVDHATHLFACDCLGRAKPDGRLHNTEHPAL